jgi:hypothetical protein
MFEECFYGDPQTMNILLLCLATLGLVGIRGLLILRYWNYPLYFYPLTYLIFSPLTRIFFSCTSYSGNVLIFASCACGYRIDESDTEPLLQLNNQLEIQLAPSYTCLCMFMKRFRSRFEF